MQEITIQEMFIQETTIRWGIKIPLRDGIHLAADLYLPKQVWDLQDLQDLQNRLGSEGLAARVPGIVLRTPYGRGSDSIVGQGRYFAERGYAFVAVDVRGRGDSEGEFVAYRREGQDGYDTIEWAAQQPWCTGVVGTIGGSYLGRIQWLTALQQPPHLRAMIPMVSPSDPFVEWPTGVPDPMHVCWNFLTADRGVQNIGQVNWERVYTHLPLLTMDEAAGRQMPTWREAFDHPYLDEWWEEICYQTRFDEIDIPVMHISGWYDDEQIGTPINFAGMTRFARRPEVRQAQRLIMGPWGHQVNTSTKIGSVDFGPTALIDLRKRQLRFFDWWLKDEDNGVTVEAPVSIFVMGVNQWREEGEWPLARTLYTPWYLHSGGHANSRFGDGVLAPLPPSGNEPADKYEYWPEHPVPFITELTSTQIGGPDDYSAIHRRDDVLVYTSSSLENPLEVTGPVKMKLFASSSAPDTDFMVQLHDVWPNGYAQRLCDGMVRVRFRKGMRRPELLEPGTVHEYEIDCWNTSHVFLPGHQIRVHVASSAFPKYDRNLNTGAPLGQTSELACAKQVVYHDVSRPSAIILPVIPK